MRNLIFLLCSFAVGFAIAASGTTYDPTNSNSLEKNRLNYNGQKMSATVPANSSQNIDITLADDHLLTGAKLTLTNPCDDDEIKFQVVSGSTVVNQFIDWYAVNIDKELQYPAKLPAGITLRAVYKNTCDTSVKVRINLFLHKILF